MIGLPSRFDDIRPYYDREIPAAMERILQSPLLDGVLAHFGPLIDATSVRSTLASVKTIEEFQKKVMLPLIGVLVEQTVSEYTFDGIENASEKTGHLFVSNHRDIVMDACLLQLSLFRNNITSCHITFGSNLMNPQFVVDVGMSNKMFRTERKVDDYETFMNASIHLSDYINYVVSHGESVWIAQRNGRTKDGFDKTDPGLLRMLLLGPDKAAALRSLHITPMAVSYQWEPCDALKTAELCRSANGKPYVKAQGEDLNSIVTGMMAPKGKAHITLCPEIDCSAFSSHIKRSDMEAVVAEMDDKIHRNYKLWDTNFAAYDILNRCCQFAGLYSPEIKDELKLRLDNAIRSNSAYAAGMVRNIFLNIYAGAVINSPEFLK